MRLAWAVPGVVKASAAIRDLTAAEAETSTAEQGDGVGEESNYFAFPSWSNADSMRRDATALRSVASEVLLVLPQLGLAAADLLFLGAALVGLDAVLNFYLELGVAGKKAESEEESPMKEGEERSLLADGRKVEGGLCCGWLGR